MSVGNPSTYNNERVIQDTESFALAPLLVEQSLIKLTSARTDVFCKVTDSKVSSETGERSIIRVRHFVKTRYMMKANIPWKPRPITYTPSEELIRQTYVIYLQHPI